MRSEPIQSKHIFYVSSHGQALTIAKQCTNDSFPKKAVGIIYGFADQPHELFLYKMEANGQGDTTEFHYDGVNYFCGEKQYANLALFTQDMKVAAISKPLYLAWYLNNHFHQLSNRARIFKPALVECENKWGLYENTIEIKDHSYIDRMNDVQELDDYILRLSKIFQINDLVSTREFYVITEEANATTCYYVLNEKHIDPMVEMALNSNSLKSLAFAEINKLGNIFQIASRVDGKTPVQKIAEFLKNKGDIEEEWDRKTDQGKIELCLSALPSDITKDPRFLLITYPDLLKQLVKEVDAEIKPSKCLIM